MNDLVSSDVRATARRIHDRLKSVPVGDHEQEMDLRMQWEQQVVFPIREELVQRDPALPFMTALVMSGDEGGALRADFQLEDGDPWERVYGLIGSYARSQWVLRHIDDGSIPRDWAIENIMHLWRDSDPDDTDPRWLLLWVEAFRRNGHVALTDGERKLPSTKMLTVYRGQIGEGVPGLAWSTNRKVAERFALTGGGREQREGGVLLEATVPRTAVFAYLTGRNEDECVVSPFALQRIDCVGRAVRADA